MSIVIRPMASADVGEVTRVHVTAFPKFFLTFLGPAFLRQLYGGILDDRGGIAFVAEHDGRIVGFVAGTDTPSRFYSTLLRRRFIRFGLASALPLLRRPSILRRLLRAFGKAADAPGAQSGRAELMSLAVLPMQQGGGSGRRLVSAFVDEVRARGGKAVFLTTDREENESVNHFYSRTLGFALVRQFTTREGRAMNEYELTL